MPTADTDFNILLTIRRPRTVTQGGTREVLGCAAAMLGEPDQAALFLTEQGSLRAASQP
ncbi:hypothetical protein [Bradyrhizobium canariense]|uniref:hypothetical protein n=1 Tax=Bradyrhizobium canariense TaxID=255045 RepID=UPI001CA5F193|nr:hypothetical protein [Bradyrhizobium canariense]